MMFNCDMCGECCRNLQYSDIYKDLDSGNGVCRYLDGNLCSIYNERPLKCRDDDCYDKFFADKMTREEYYQENYKMCEELKKRREI